jgi:hypothetical protein
MLAMYKKLIHRNEMIECGVWLINRESVGKSGGGGFAWFR